MSARCGLQAKRTPIRNCQQAVEYHSLRGKSSAQRTHYFRSSSGFVLRWPGASGLRTCWRYTASPQNTDGHATMPQVQQPMRSGAGSAAKSSAPEPACRARCVPAARASTQAARPNLSGKHRI